MQGSQYNGILYSDNFLHNDTFPIFYTGGTIGPAGALIRGPKIGSFCKETYFYKQLCRTGSGPEIN